MTQPTYDADRWLSPTERAALKQAIAADRANTEQPTRDTCDCGGHGCLRCAVGPFVRKSLKSQQVRLR